ncbi:Unknown protein sequence [Pseudomonas amygdali pv. lachrymans]|nr:Unknown protein sequence [Pseudomonas amygdali pv. lachrymans]
MEELLELFESHRAELLSIEVRGECDIEQSIEVYWKADALGLFAAHCVHDDAPERMT